MKPEQAKAFRDISLTGEEIQAIGRHLALWPNDTQAREILTARLRACANSAAEAAKALGGNPCDE